MEVTRLIFIVEGETEEMFVSFLLAPYLCAKGFQGSVTAIKPKKTGGGLSKYSDVEKLLKNVICESGAIVSTIFDFYALPSSFPGVSNLSSTNHFEQVKEIEHAMLEDMKISLSRPCLNYIPHIQLHEFESLIFSSADGLDTIFDADTKGYAGVRELILTTDNPETINNGAKTAPSKRLLNISGYNKILHGNIALEAIGMNKLLAKCPHFAHWIEELLKALQITQ